MKKVLILMAAAMVIAGCKKEGSDTEPIERFEVVPIVFDLAGDWQQTAKDLTANGSAMTDVWVIDATDGVLVHQADNTAADFGQPTVELGYGQHTLYFVASRGATPTLSEANHAITWVKPSDTFWQTVTLTVDANTGRRAATLDRIVAKLKMTINDAIAEGVTAFEVTPSAWHFGMDYTTGNPTAAESGVISVNCPSSSIGQSGQFLTVYTFSGTTQWQTNVTLAAKAGSTTVSSVTMNNVPIQRNRSTEYSGNLFTGGGSTSLTLNDTWGDPFNGTW